MKTFVMTVWTALLFWGSTPLCGTDTTFFDSDETVVFRLEAPISTLKKQQVEGSVFAGLDRIKVVAHCPTYDFDISGLVNVSYAVVNPNFPILSVRDRLYRGLETSNDTLKAVFNLFLKEEDETLPEHGVRNPGEYRKSQAAISLIR